MIEDTSKTRNNKIYKMSFSTVYDLYILKVEKKGRTKEEVDMVISWLTGYEKEDIKDVKERNFEEFFALAPSINPLRKEIKGSICNVKLEEIEDPLMQNIRYLDKLVDEIAKGKTMEKILRK